MLQAEPLLVLQHPQLALPRWGEVPSLPVDWVWLAVQPLLRLLQVQPELELQPC